MPASVSARLVAGVNSEGFLRIDGKGMSGAPIGVRPVASPRLALSSTKETRRHRARDPSEAARRFKGPSFQGALFSRGFLLRGTLSGGSLTKSGMAKSETIKSETIKSETTKSEPIKSEASQTEMSKMS